jgi:hypothetical protein
MKKLILLPLLGLLVLSIGCASKQYVSEQTSPLADRISQIEGKMPMMEQQAKEAKEASEKAASAAKQSQEAAIKAEEAAKKGQKPQPPERRKRPRMRRLPLKRLPRLLNSCRESKGFGVRKAVSGPFF